MTMRRAAWWGVGAVLLAVLVAFVGLRWRRSPGASASGPARAEGEESGAAAAADDPRTARSRARAGIARPGRLDRLAEVVAARADAPPPIPGAPALDGEAFVEADPPSMKLVQRGIKESVQPRAAACVSAFVTRHPSGRFGTISMTIDLEVSSRDRAGTITAAAVEEWPAALDAEAKSCLLAAFTDAEFETDDFDFDYKLSYPLKFRLPE